MEPSKCSLVLQSYLIYIAHPWSLPRAHFFCALICYANCQQRLGVRRSAGRYRCETCSYLQASLCGNSEKPVSRIWKRVGCHAEIYSLSMWCWRELKVSPHHGYSILEKGRYCGWCWVELFWNLGFLKVHSRLYKGWKHKNNWAFLKSIFGGDPVVPELTWLPFLPPWSL